MDKQATPLWLGCKTLWLQRLRSIKWKIVSISFWRADACSRSTSEDLYSWHILLFFTFLRAEHTDLRSAELLCRCAELKNRKMLAEMANGPQYLVSSREPSQLKRERRVRVSKLRSGKEKKRVRVQMERTMLLALANCCKRVKKCKEFGCCSSGCQHS